MSNLSKCRHLIRRLITLDLHDPWRTMSYPLQAFGGRNNMLGAIAPQRDWDFLDPPKNLCPTRLTSTKTIALAFLKATSPQIPY